MLAKKILRCLVVALVAVVFGASTVLAADKPVLTVGSSTFNEKEILEIMTENSGGNRMIVGMMLAQSTLPERVNMANQMADAIVFAEGAQASGLALRPDIAFQIRWQTMQILINSYFDKFSSKWDMSEKAIKKYYETHSDEFFQKPAAHVRHILCQTEAEAVNAIIEIYRTKDFEKVAIERSLDQNTAQSGGDMGWVEKGVMAPPVDKAISDASIGGLVAPVKSEFGWHVIEVLERRSAKQLNYEEAREDVIQNLQKSYLAKEIKELKGKHKVVIDEQALANLGGVPAPEEPKK